MGYKLLGFAVWQGGKWYLRRRVGVSKRTVVLTSLAAAAVVGAVAVGQRQLSHS
jgi:hypothetical protein